MSWNDEKVNKLKELWGKVNTASEIAQILGGVSRNAVIGKAHRLNLSGKIKSKKISVNSSKNNNEGKNFPEGENSNLLLLKKTLSLKIQNSLKS